MSSRIIENHPLYGKHPPLADMKVIAEGLETDPALRRVDAAFLRNLVRLSRHKRVALRFVMNLPDVVFNDVMEGHGSRMTSLHPAEQIAICRRIAQADIMTEALARNTIVLCVQQNDPELLSFCLDRGFSQRSSTPHHVLICAAIEATRSPEIAKPLMGWIRERPDLYLTACLSARNRLENNPKPALVLLSIPGLDLPDRSLRLIASALGEGNPYADLFSPSRHSAIKRHAFARAHELETVIATPMRELRRMLVSS